MFHEGNDQLITTNPTNNIATYPLGHPWAGLFAALVTNSKYQKQVRLDRRQEAFHP
jgi:hypothetical protein